MSAQPIEHPPLTDSARINDNRVAVQSLLDYLVLPTPTLVVRTEAVHITVAGRDELGAWLYALGGEVRRGPEIDGASLWTLRTQTPARADGSTVAIRVHAPVVAGDEVLAEFRPAVTS
ncbi:hypothetical protein [Streptomyces chryseus]|uniref:hypothetical protein n=1 Tax=Streptomyces chryseus TaxID=68186 RepID=UPI00110F923A|nr:hypothetical protein [Streptomyces chryseus]GGX02260.1 hypothetical protein GCM10010353_17470 [Streptomyces chryseus]